MRVASARDEVREWQTERDGQCHEPRWRPRDESDRERGEHEQQQRALHLGGAHVEPADSEASKEGIAAGMVQRIGGMMDDTAASLRRIRRGYEMRAWRNVIQTADPSLRSG